MYVCMLQNPINIKMILQILAKNYFEKKSKKLNKYSNKTQE
jgi:hypothetical protein